MNKQNGNFNSLELVLKGMSFQHQAGLIKASTLIREEHKIPATLISDSTLFRFYSACKGDINLTVERILRHIAWRKDFPFDLVVSLDLSRFDFLWSCIKMGFYGTDAKGRPVRLIYVTEFDPDAVLSRYSDEELIYFYIQYIERIINIIFPLCSEKSGNSVSNILSIIDIKDMNVAKILLNKRYLNLFGKMSNIFEANYPEITYKAIIVNVGMVFLGLWKVFSVFMSERTLQKISMVGEDFLSHLTKHVPVTQLPEHFKGTCPYEIDKFPNFFDEALNKSIKERQIGV